MLLYYLGSLLFTRREYDPVFVANNNGGGVPSIGGLAKALLIMAHRGFLGWSET